MWCIIDEYQTLITGVLAVLAALATIYLINRQIRQTKDIEADRIRRKSRSARAAMPAALSIMCQYADQCIAFVARAYEQVSEGKDPADAFAKERWLVPQLPDGVLVTMKDCVEFADEASAEKLAELLKETQIQNSRFRRLVESLSGEMRQEAAKFLDKASLADDIIDAADLYVRLSGYFGYARGIESEPNAQVDGKKVNVHLIFQGIDEGRFSGVFDRLKLRYKSLQHEARKTD